MFYEINNPFLILTIHLVATCLMTGVLWMVQLVHYPTFLFVEKKGFADFEMFHGRQISKIVIPLMFIELGTGLILVSVREFSKVTTIGNLAGIVALWLITFFVSARCHHKLTEGFDLKIVQRLIGTNWFRTGLWTFRTLLVAQLLVEQQEKFL